MQVIHTRITSNLNRMFEPYLNQIRSPSSTDYAFESVGDHQGPHEVILLIAPRLLTATYVNRDTKKWNMLVHKVNKDGSMSKRFRVRIFDLNVPVGCEEDAEKITSNLMEVLLFLEKEPQYKPFLEDDPVFQYVYKPAMTAALNSEKPTPRNEETTLRVEKAHSGAEAAIPRVESSRSYESPRRADPKVAFWIAGALILAAIIGSSSSSAPYPDNCYFSPDPRGGFIEC